MVTFSSLVYQVRIARSSFVSVVAPKTVRWGATVGPGGALSILTSKMAGSLSFSLASEATRNKETRRLKYPSPTKPPMGWMRLRGVGLPH